jgi:hypothetical protein
VPDEQCLDERLEGLRVKALASWLSLVDECLAGSAKAMTNAAPDYDSVDALSHLITDLERRAGRQLMGRTKPGNFRVPARKRSDAITPQGILLAEIAATIEHIVLFFQQSGDPARALKEFAPVKDAVFAGLRQTPLRERDRQKYSGDRKQGAVAGDDDRFRARLAIMGRQHNRHVEELGLIGNIFKARFENRIAFPMIR